VNTTLVGLAVNFAELSTSGASAYEIGECTGFRDVSVEDDLAAKMVGRDAKEFQSEKSHGREVRNRTVRGETPCGQGWQSNLSASWLVLLRGSCIALFGSPSSAWHTLALKNLAVL